MNSGVYVRGRRHLPQNRSPHLVTAERLAAFALAEFAELGVERNSGLLINDWRCSDGRLWGIMAGVGPLCDGGRR